MNGAMLQSPRIRRIAAAVLVLLLLAVGVYLWWVSEQIWDGAFKPRHGARDLGLEVVAVSDEQITLHSISDSNWERPGIWGLEWRTDDGLEGFVQLTGILEIDEEQRWVTRALGSGVPPPVGAKARLENLAFDGDPGGLGLPFIEISYETPLGPMRAWQVCEGASQWAIFVHGRGSNQREVLRILPTLSELGLTTMALWYRNDEGLPASTSGHYDYGASEWEDLEAAVRHALDAGADEVVLIGYSMGGGIVSSFLLDSELADEVDLVMLDSPMLDLHTTVSSALSDGGLPGPLRAMGMWFTAQRFDVDWAATDYLRRVDEFVAPTLILHGTDDDLVPVELSDEFVERLEVEVTYEQFEGAHHTGAWNLEPERYEAAVERFLSEGLSAGNGSSTCVPAP